MKIQVEFNPATVAEYRLIGYETRMLEARGLQQRQGRRGRSRLRPHGDRDLRDHAGGRAARARRDPLRATRPRRRAPVSRKAGEYGFLKIRYKLPKEDVSRLLTLPINAGLEKKSVAEAPAEVRFSTAVAGFGQLLRGSPYLKSFGYDEVIALGQAAKGDDPFGYRAEFLNLVRLAKSARP